MFNASDFQPGGCHVNTATLRTFLAKEGPRGSGRVTGYSIEPDGVFIYTDSRLWCDDAGAGTFRGDSETGAIKAFRERVQRAEVAPVSESMSRELVTSDACEPTESAIAPSEYFATVWLASDVGHVAPLGTLSRPRRFPAETGPARGLFVLTDRHGNAVAYFSRVPTVAGVREAFRKFARTVADCDSRFCPTVEQAREEERDSMARAVRSGEHASEEGLAEYSRARFLTLQARAYHRGASFAALADAIEDAATREANAERIRERQRAELAATVARLNREAAEREERDAAEREARARALREERESEERQSAAIEETARGLFGDDMESETLAERDDDGDDGDDGGNAPDGGEEPQSGPQSGQSGPMGRAAADSALAEWWADLAARTVARPMRDARPARDILDACAARAALSRGAF